MKFGSRKDPPAPKEEAPTGFRVRVRVTVKVMSQQRFLAQHSVATLLRDCLPCNITFGYVQIESLLIEVFLLPLILQDVQLSCFKVTWHAVINF